MLEDACEALGAVDADGRRVGARGNLADLRLLRQQADDHGRGRDARPAPAPDAARLRSERNQGRAPDMGWLDHERLGFNYRLTDLQAAIGVAQLERLDELLAARAGWRRCTARRRSAGGRRALEARRCAGRGAERRSWFVYAVRLPAGADRDAVDRPTSPSAASRQGLPAVHPPVPAPPRAVRLPRGPVPGRRGGLGAARSRCRSSRR